MGERPLVVRRGRKAAALPPAAPTHFEQEQWDRGILWVAGLDEAGRGPLAGPVCAAAVVLRPGTVLPHVTDSKLMDEAARMAAAELIRREALSWGVGWSTPDEIDRTDILRATKRAMARAIRQLKVWPEFLLLDAVQLQGWEGRQLGMPKGDQRSLSIAAASILAKTERDLAMARAAEEYPGYGFEKHKGYPTPVHYAAIRSLGPCAIHRRSFLPGDD